MPALNIGFEVIVEVFSLLITLFITGFSFHAYLITKQRKHEFLSIAFLLISIGILLNILFSASMPSADINQALRGELALGTIPAIVLFSSLLFRLAGYMTIFMITEQIENKKVIFFLYVLVAFVILSATQFYYWFHLVNFLVLSFVFTHFYRNYQMHTTRSSLLVMLSFGVLALSQLVFLVSVFDRATVAYNAGYIVRMVSFALLFAALIMIYRPATLFGRRR